MFNFFDEFFKSDLAKNHVVAFIVLSILLIIIGAFFMWLYMSKIKMAAVLNKFHEFKNQISNLTKLQNSLREELEKVKEERDDLLKQQDKLRFHEELTYSEQIKNSDYIDSALEHFAKKES